MTEADKEKGLCFVIMSFAEDKMLRLSYKYGVKQTVEGLGYRCERTDEMHFDGLIYEKIIESLNQADFIIADLSHAKQNCYYELGIAHALNKKVIHIIHVDEELHFDVQGFRFIKYRDAEDLENQLKPHLQHTISKLKRNVLHLTQNESQDTGTETTVLSGLSMDIKITTVELTTDEALDTILEKTDVVLYSCTPDTDAHDKAERLINALQRNSNPIKLLVFADKDLPDETYRLLTSHPKASVSKMADALSGRLKNSLA